MTTTTSYGTWCNQVDQYSTSVEHTVGEAFGSFGADDYDFDGIVRAYRDAINSALPDSVTLAGDEFIGPAYAEDQDWTGYPTVQGPDGLEDEYEGSLDIAAIVEDVDLNAVMKRHELWDASRVAQELGYTSKSAEATARKRLSAWGVKALVHRPNPDSGRVQAYYLSGDVTEARAGHPVRAKAGA